MTDFIEACIKDSSLDEGDIDSQRILIKALSAVLPEIIKNELTEKQNLCFRLFYVHGNTQSDIARKLKLSQPTVSRHIATAKAVINKILSYCFSSVKRANEQWLKIE